MLAKYTSQNSVRNDDLFARCHAFVALAEGGVSDHPADRGGLTAHGASLAFVRSIAASPAGREFLRGLGLAVPASGQVGPETILAIGPEQAAAIFRREFWDKAGLDRLCAAGLGLAPAMVIYDTAVNCGLRAAVRLAQRAWNSLPATARQGQPDQQIRDREAAACLLVVDGSLGPRTRAALLAADQTALARAILAVRRQYYRDIVAGRPSQSVFLRGWLNRCQNLAARLGL